jgi:hypothetical protein
MEMSDIDRQFLALTDNLRFEVDGLHEYVDVTADLKQLEDDFADHLVALDGIDMESDDADAVLQFLHVQLTKSLESLGRVTIGDKFITRGEGIIIRMDEQGMQHIENLADDIRLHGTIGDPYVIEAPLSIDAIYDDTVLEYPDSLAVRPAVAIEIYDAAIEVADPGAPYNTPEPVGPQERVFLPIIYPGLRINRQIPQQLQ